MERSVGSVVAGKYRLIRVLGRGGMGVVYEAEHAMTRRRVAVKVLHAHHKESSDAAKRFINEAQSAGRIQHPNVVEVLDAGEDADGSLYLVLELLSGQDLATQLMRVRRLEVADTLTIIAQVLQALVVAHRQGIIHRDIKPENIYLTRSVTGDTVVKILDFGISKAIGGDQAFAPSVTQTNTTVGTPHYMSPEQARGERTIDTRADLWAVGVVMFECLAGKVPFDGETYNDQIVRVITEPHEPLGDFDVPGEISRIVDRALEKDRNRRYAQAAQMLTDIRQFVQRHPEYSSVPAHYLREPQPVRTPPPPVMLAGSNDLTLDTASDPAFDPFAPPSSDTMPTAPASASLFDSANEDMPTTVKASPHDEPAFARILPLAGHRAAIDGVGAASSPVVAAHDEGEPSRERRRFIVVGAGLMIASIAVGTLVALTTGRPSVQAPVHVSAAPQLAATVSVRFVGGPAGASVSVGGAQAPSGVATLARSTTPLPVVVTAPGFAPMQFALVPDRDQTVPLMLSPVPAAIPSPTVTPSPAALPSPTVAPTPTALPSPTFVPVPVPVPVEPQPVAAMPPAPRTSQPRASSAHAAATRTAPPPAATRTAPAPAVVPPPAPRGGSGALTVRGNGCTIAIDGQIRGQTPLNHFVVPPGPHRVICRTRTGAIRSRAVTVQAGAEAIVDFE